MKKSLFLFGYIVCSLQAQRDESWKNILRASRRVNTATVRNVVTRTDAGIPLSNQPVNSEEQLYPDKRASFGKALAQLNSGLIDPQAFETLVLGINANSQETLNSIAMGTRPVERKLVDPQALFAYNLNSADGWLYTIPAAPAITSAKFAAYMVELYWMVLLRDVPFNEYDTNPIAQAAIAELNTLSDYTGPTPVTAQNLFRSTIPGVIEGPYVSQFLYLPVPYGPVENTDNGVMGTPGIDFQAQVVPTSTTLNDFMTTFSEWHFIQEGNFPVRTTAYTTDRLFIRNGRDLAEYVHFDYPMQEYLNAALILNGFGQQALDPANPYLGNPTQEPFVTYYLPDVMYLIGLASEYALRAAWYQKWFVHRFIRPEFAGFLINQQKTGNQDFGLSQEIINATVLDEIETIFGTFFLPQAFPEGSPTHPSYPQGHSTVAGACVTILKAFFNQDFIIPNPLEPNLANTQLRAFVGPALTVGNELNKLAFNAAVGRDHAGVHYLCDCVDGLMLGQQVALSILQDESFTRNIPFAGYTLTKFDGTTVVIGGKKTVNTLN